MAGFSAIAASGSRPWAISPHVQGFRHSKLSKLRVAGRALARFLLAARLWPRPVCSGFTQHFGRSFSGLPGLLASRVDNPVGHRLKVRRGRRRHYAERAPPRA
jgi:hypothetical protein